MKYEDPDSTDPEKRHPAIQNPPNCRKCELSTQLHHVNPLNQNGNGNRPYYKCSHCGMFSCFGDMRGVLEDNPTCFCNGGMQLSRRGISCKKGRRPIRSIFYCCATGKCDFFGDMMDDEGVIQVFSGSLTREGLIRKGCWGASSCSILSMLWFSFISCQIHRKRPVLKWCPCWKRVWSLLHNQESSNFEDDADSGLRAIDTLFCFYLYLVC